MLSQLAVAGVLPLVHMSDPLPSCFTLQSAPSKERQAALASSMLSPDCRNMYVNVAKSY